MRESREGLQKRPPLTEHEEKVQDLLLELSEAVKGFPETDRGLDNITRAWAKFISLEPYHVTDPPHLVPFLSRLDEFGNPILSREELDARKAPHMWKEGIIPGEWLIEKIRDGCQFMPTPIEARQMYCGVGFPPADGKEPVQLDARPSRQSMEE